MANARNFLPQRLLTRLTLSGCAVLLVALSLYALHLISEAQALIEAKLTEDARAIAGAIGKITADRQVLQDRGAIERQLMQLAQMPHVAQIQVLDANGSIIADILRNENDGTLEVRDGSPPRSLPADTAMHVERQGSRLEIWQPMLQMRVTGWVYLVYTLDAAHALQVEVRNDALTAILLAMPLCALLFALVLRRPVRDIRGTAEFATRMAETPGLQLPAMRTSYEVGQLRAALNAASTRLKHTNDAIRVLDERLQAVLHSLPDLVFYKDCAGKFLGWNRACEEFFGKTEAEIIGCSDFDFFPAEQAQAFREADQAMLACRRPMLVEECLSSARGERCLFETLKSPLYAADGTVVGMLGVSRDITERKSIEAALQTSEARYRSLFDHAGDAILMVQDGTIMDCNWRALEVFGCASRANLIGTSLAALAPKLQPDGRLSIDVAREYDAVAASGTALHFEWRHRRLDGREFDAAVSLTGYTLEGSHIVQGIVRDITDHKRLVAELEKARVGAELASEAKSNFLANMSHEIRTPMNAILGMAELCIATDLSGKQRNYLSKIRSASTSLLRIVNDILDFSKIEAGKLSLESTPFDLDSVLDSLAALLAPSAESKGIELLFDLEPGLPQNLVGDPLRLGQVLTNLVSNAIKFSLGGNVVVSVRALAAPDAGAELEFAVSDEGIGISAEQQARLFQSFSQADTSTTRRYGGTGLGLAICKRLVELMGGRIGVDSEPGRGSTFRFTVPFARSVAARAADALPALPAEPAAGRNVLVIDDNPIVRRIAQSLLEQMGLSSEVYASGAAALARLALPDAPDYLCALVDWRMPELDGVQTIRRLRAHYAPAKAPPVILMTAFGHAEALREIDERLDGFITKPLGLRTLFAEIAPLLGLAGAGGQCAVAVDATPSQTVGQLQSADILLVEDVDINREVMLGLLQSVGLQARTASNGVEALQAVAAARPDVVLMDCQMPVMDGYEATRRLRADPRTADLPVIAITANAMASGRSRCLEAGMNAWLTKPVHLADLLEALVKWVAPRGPEAAPSRPAQAGVPAPAQVSAIADLDLRAGLAQVGGKIALYRKLLEKFRTSHCAEFEPKMRAALASSDWPAAVRLAHSLKGVARTLGAFALGDLALAVEHAARATDAEAMAPALAALNAHLNNLRHALADLRLQPVAAPAAEGTAQWRGVLERLQGLLAQFDTEAGDVVRELAAMPADTMTRVRVTRLTEAVDAYRYEEAAKLAAALLASLATSSAALETT